VQASAALAALAASAFLVWTERRLGSMQEAIIGILFVVAASAELLLLAFNPHGAEHLKDLLVGQILWVEPERLLWTAACYALLGLLVWRGDLARRRVLFYVVFALTVTVSVQLVGVLLVFASLVIPPLAARLIGATRRIRAAYVLGILGYGGGLLGSALLDLPTGAAIVCALALAAGIAVTLSGQATTT
jgi:zinc/manganese transport system permease protein